MEEISIWFEARLTAEPITLDDGQAVLLRAMVDTDAGPREASIRAEGGHVGNVESHAAEGAAFLIRSHPADDGAGYDVIADAIAFNPSHAEAEEDEETADDGAGYENGEPDQWDDEETL